MPDDDDNLEVYNTLQHALQLLGDVVASGEYTEEEVVDEVKSRLDV